VREQIMQHVYAAQSSVNTNTSATKIPAVYTSLAEICSIATDNMSLWNELQNAISAASVVQISTSKTAKEFEFGSLHK
jgi:Tfp pilus assembly protein PilX